MMSLIENWRRDVASHAVSWRHDYAIVTLLDIPWLTNYPISQLLIINGQNLCTPNSMTSNR